MNFFVASFLLITARCMLATHATSEISGNSLTAEDTDTVQPLRDCNLQKYVRSGRALIHSLCPAQFDNSIAPQLLLAGV